MLDFHEKRKLKSFLYSKPVALLFLAAAAYFSLSVFERYQVERDVAEKRREKSAELETLSARAAALEAEVQHLKSERGIEEEIRERYEVAKEGEEVVVIVGEGEEPPKEPQREGHAPWYAPLLFWR